MSSLKQNPAPMSVPAASVDQALIQTEQVTEEIKRASDDLAVVHAVLDTKLPKEPNDPDVQHAVAETLEVEKRLEKSAEKLEQVKQVLATSGASPGQGGGAASRR